MRAYPGLAAILLILLAVSCSDMSAFGPQDAVPASIEVRSLRDGGLVQVGDPLAYVVHAERQPGEDLVLEATLLDAAGGEAWSGTLASPQLEGGLQAHAAGPPPGLCRPQP